MRRFNFLATAAAVTATLTFASTALAQDSFGAVLDGGQQVPPNGSTATGTATLELNDAQDRLTIFIELFGLDLDGNQTTDPNDDVISMHIHDGPTGVNGPVVFGFISPNNDLNGDLVIDPVAGTVSSAWDLNEGNNTTLDAQLADLFNDGLYINVHTNAFAGGEIRGQILLIPAPGAVALLGVAGVCGRRRRRIA